MTMFEVQLGKTSTMFFTKTRTLTGRTNRLYYVNIYDFYAAKMNLKKKNHTHPHNYIYTQIYISTNRKMQMRSCVMKRFWETI